MTIDAKRLRELRDIAAGYYERHGRFPIDPTVTLYAALPELLAVFEAACEYCDDITAGNLRLCDAIDAARRKPGCCIHGWAWYACPAGSSRASSTGQNIRWLSPMHRASPTTPTHRASRHVRAQSITSCRTRSRSPTALTGS